MRCGICLIEAVAPYAPVAEKLLNRVKEGIPLFFLEEGIRAGGAGVLLKDALDTADPTFLASRGYEIFAADGYFSSSVKECAPTAYCGIDEETVVSRIQRRVRVGK